MAYRKNYIKLISLIIFIVIVILVILLTKKTEGFNGKCVNWFTRGPVSHVNCERIISENRCKLKSECRWRRTPQTPQTPQTEQVPNNNNPTAQPDPGPVGCLPKKYLPGYARDPAGRDALCKDKNKHACKHAAHSTFCYWREPGDGPRITEAWEAEVIATEAERQAKLEEEFERIEREGLEWTARRNCKKHYYDKWKKEFMDKYYDEKAVYDEKVNKLNEEINALQVKLDEASSHFYPELKCIQDQKKIIADLTNDINNKTVEYENYLQELLDNIEETKKQIKSSARGEITHAMLPPLAPAIGTTLTSVSVGYLGYDAQNFLADRAKYLQNIVNLMKHIKHLENEFGNAPVEQAKIMNELENKLNAANLVLDKCRQRYEHHDNIYKTIRDEQQYPLIIERDNLKKPDLDIPYSSYEHPEECNTAHIGDRWYPTRSTSSASSNYLYSSVNSPKPKPTSKSKSKSKSRKHP